MSNTRCFVSYCHDDIDRDVLEFVTYMLSSSASGSFSLLVDHDLPYGEDLNGFMAHLETVDAVLLLLTPRYKEKVEERQGGVYHEYTRIMARYDRFHRLKKDGKKVGEIDGYFEVIPIVLAGDPKKCILDDVRHLKYLSLSGLRIRKDEGQFTITDYVRQRYVPEISRLADRLHFIATLKRPSFEELYKSYYHKLFLELKAEWSNPKNALHGYLDNLFVKTYAYLRVENQAVYFMIGRKGSGKSTVAEALAIRQDQRYKGSIAIMADDLDLESPYALLTNEQLQSDTRFVLPRLQCFEFAWEAFIYLCCMDVLIKLARDNHLTQHQQRFAPTINKYISRLTTDGKLSLGDRYRTFFVYAFTQAARYVEHAIDTARPDDTFYFADIQAKLTRDKFLSYAIGPDVIRSLESIVDTCRKRFLVTLDGFDTSFDMFRRRSIIEHRFTDLATRTAFEIDWLRSLLTLVLRVKQRDDGTNRLYSLLDFCITLPKDRFYEVFMTERDSYRFHNHVCTLDWSGLELAILLRKRLEELTQWSTDKSRYPSPEDRLGHILREKFPHIPVDISFEHNGHSYSMPLFLYVLRHTFWRPRDVLLYYAKIISTAEELRKKKVKITTDAVRRAVREVTYEVIQSEFINEFESSLVNIRSVLEAFARSTQFITFDSLASTLTRLQFSFAASEVLLDSIEQKIEFLYHIGFLGIAASEELQERLNLAHRHAFYFNERSAPLRNTGPKRFHDYSFIIHPIFSEFLQLDTSANEFVLDLDWEYLHTMEALLFASGSA